MQRSFIAVACMGLALASPPLLHAQGESASVVQPATGWYWDGRPQLSHVLVLVYDAQSQRLRQAYMRTGGTPPCKGSRVSDSTLIPAAARFLYGVGWDMAHPNGARLRQLGSQFIVVGYNAGDFDAEVVYHRDGGLILSVTRVWMGTGRLLYPAEPLDPWALTHLSSVAPPPTTSDGEEAPRALLSKARSLNAVHALAKLPYSITAYYHDRSLEGHGLDPSWILLLTRAGKCF
jgi:hypothetical protein